MTEEIVNKISKEITKGIYGLSVALDLDDGRILIYYDRRSIYEKYSERNIEIVKKYTDDFTEIVLDK